MKEIMLPYILIMWILVKLGVIKWNLRNATYMVSAGFFISFMLFTAHRFWSPADLTDSTTVKAPHAVLSPLVGEQIKEVFVIHNQKLKKGDIVYSLVDTESTAILEGIEADIEAQDTIIEQRKRDIQRDLDAPGVFAKRDVERIKSDMKAALSQKESLQAEYEQALFEQNRKTIKAPFDGQVSITNIAEGSRIGNMHFYNTGKKFVEMRIPDQAYRYIEKGQFAEFYVNAYPGEIFRGRVHSITVGTGEAMVNPRGTEQKVTQHVKQNMPAHGRTIIIEFIEPEGYDIPIGATGSGWVSARKPMAFLGFMDIVGAATVRLKAYKAYLNAM